MECSSSADWFIELERGWGLWTPFGTNFDGPTDHAVRYSLGKAEFEAHFFNGREGTQTNLATGKVRRLVRLEPGQKPPAWEGTGVRRRSPLGVPSKAAVPSPPAGTAAYAAQASREVRRALGGYAGGATTLDPPVAGKSSPPTLEPTVVRRSSAPEIETLAASRSTDVRTGATKGGASVAQRIVANGMAKHETGEQAPVERRSFPGANPTGDVSESGGGELVQAGVASSASQAISNHQANIQRRRPSGPVVNVDSNQAGGYPAAAKAGSTIPRFMRHTASSMRSATAEVSPRM